MKLKLKLAEIIILNFIKPKNKQENNKTQTGIPLPEIIGTSRG